MSGTPNSNTILDIYPALLIDGGSDWALGFTPSDIKLVRHGSMVLLTNG